MWICRACETENNDAAFLCRACGFEKSREAEEAAEVGLEEIEELIPRSDRADAGTCDYCGDKGLVGETCTLCGRGTYRDRSDACGRYRIRMAEGETVSVCGDTALLIGRESANEEIARIFKAYGAVSRRHASIVFMGESIEITDLNSTNKTFVDGRVLNPGTPEVVALPAKIRLGQACYIEVMAHE
jgi:hypothetical protein